MKCFKRVLLLLCHCYVYANEDHLSLTWQHKQQQKKQKAQNQQKLERQRRLEEDLDLIKCRIILWHAMSVDILKQKPNPLEIPGQLKAECEDGILYDIISSSTDEGHDDIEDEDGILDLYFHGNVPSYGLTEITIPKSVIVPSSPLDPPTTRTSTGSSTTSTESNIPKLPPKIDLSKAPIIRQEEKAFNVRMATRDVTTGNYTVGVIRVITADDEPTASATQLSDDIFGTYSDVYNLKSGYAACSGNKLNFHPGNTSGLVNGVYELTLSINSYGVSSSTVQSYAESSLSNTIKSSVDYLMYVFPGNVNFGGAAAYAYLPGTTSFYDDTYASTYIVIMHELGHNLGHHHSGLGSAEYGDYSCWMGAHSYLDEGPDACFNGPKSYWFGWYSNLDKEPSVNGVNTSLVGINDYINGETGDDHIVALRLYESYYDDIYVYYNKKEGVNGGVVTYGDRVTVARQPGARSISWHEAALDSGESYRRSNWGGTGKDLVIEVCSMESGTPDIAHVIAYVEDVSIAYCTPPEPTISPAPSLSPAPTTLDVGPSIVINNGLIMLGVNREGHLNAPGDPDAHSGESQVGLRYYRDGGWYDSMSFGCLCEGFGVSALIKKWNQYDDDYYIEKDDDDDGDYYVDDFYYEDNGVNFWGGASASNGVSNIDSSSLISNGVYATSTITIAPDDSYDGPPQLKITHDYQPSSITDNLYQVTITYKNMLANETLTNLRYRRVIDWDIPPSPYNECVSLFFKTAPSGLEYATDDGFESMNPLFDVSTSGIDFSCPDGDGCPVYDSGPSDHGALMQFLFRNDTGGLIELNPGETFSFEMFIGAADTKADADEVLGQVGAEISSYSYPPMYLGCNANNTGSPNVFMLGFRGVGGSPIFNDSPSFSPLPSSQPSISFPPSTTPSSNPSFEPTLSLKPSTNPTNLPSSIPSVSLNPTSSPSTNPSSQPSISKLPSSNPSSAPSISRTSVAIDNGLVKLGINKEGHLNAYVGYDNIGLRYYRDGGWYDATTAGCDCEGFGVSAKSSSGYNYWGGASQNNGVDNVMSSSLTSDGETYAESVVSISNALEVTHEFEPSPDTDNLYRVTITYKNILSYGNLTELRYRRVVDWDIPPDTMNECVSIFFNDVPGSLEYVTDDGFENNNPLFDASTSGIDFSCPGGDGCPVYDSGPMDHGALLQFLFKDVDDEYIELAPGETFSFDMFYGAASTKEEANNALVIVSAEIASYGYPPTGYSCGPSSSGTPNVFILAFRGVGGSAITKPPTVSPSISSQPTMSSQPTSTVTLTPTIDTTVNPTTLASSAIIDNGMIMLGINQEGHLHVYDTYYGSVGIRYYRDGEWYESTSHGCECEGFGVSASVKPDDDDDGEGYSIWGGASADSGIYSLSKSYLVNHDSESVTTHTVVSNLLRITHEFRPSIHENLYQATVTYENLSDHTLSELRYRRVHDFDIPPTLYKECVSIFFDSLPNSLEYATDDGFESVNPLIDVSTSGIDFSCPDGVGCPVYDSGPMDHGALFQFLFKDSNDDLIELAPGDKFSFDIFYGAAATKEEANDALAAVGSEISSFGYPPMSYGCDASNPGSPNVFMLAFSGLGGLSPSNSPSKILTLDPTDLSEDTASPTPSSSPDSSTPSPTPASSNTCVESVTFFYKKKHRTCYWIGRNIRRMGKYCPNFEVRMACPITCGHCCGDRPSFRFLDWKGKIRDCAWVEDNRKDYCNGYILKFCPMACGLCWM